MVQALLETETESPWSTQTTKVEPKDPFPNRPTCGNGRLKRLVEALPQRDFSAEDEAKAAIAAIISDTDECDYIPQEWSPITIIEKLVRRGCIKYYDGKRVFISPPAS